MGMVSEAVEMCMDEAPIDLIIMGTKETHSALEKSIGGVSA